MAMMTGILLCFNWVGLYYKAFKKIMFAESLLIDSNQPYFFEKKTKTPSTGELGLAATPVVAGSKLFLWTGFTGIISFIRSKIQAAPYLGTG